MTAMFLLVFCPSSLPLVQAAETLPPGPVLALKGRYTADSEGESATVTRVNQWTVGIAGGQPEGSYSRFAAELAKALDDGDNLRVLPIVTYGATENVSDLLYLRGVDLAITNADVFEEFKKQRNISNIDKRVNYVTAMFVSELHIIARPEIKSLKDLEGKTVSLGRKGAGQTITGPIVFSRMGVRPQFVFIDNTLAYEKMKTGEVSALIHSASKPNDFIAKLEVEPGFHLLEIPYSAKFTDYYVPAIISAQDYPNFLKDNQAVETIGNSVVLAVYSWPAGHERQRRIERFIQYLFERVDNLKQPTFHAKWQEINIGARVPGWKRYPPAARILERIAQARARQRISPTASIAAGGSAPAEPERSGPDASREQKLYEEFLEWKRKARR